MYTKYAPKICAVKRNKKHKGEQKHKKEMDSNYLNINSLLSIYGILVLLCTYRDLLTEIIKHSL